MNKFCSNKSLNSYVWKFWSAPPNTLQLRVLTGNKTDAAASPQFCWADKLLAIAERVCMRVRFSGAKFSHQASNIAQSANICQHLWPLYHLAINVVCQFQKKARLSVIWNKQTLIKTNSFTFIMKKIEWHTMIFKSRRLRVHITLLHRSSCLKY